MTDALFTVARAIEICEIDARFIHQQLSRALDAISVIAQYVKEQERDMRLSQHDFIEGTRHGLDIARHHARIEVQGDTTRIDFSTAQAEVEGHAEQAESDGSLLPRATVEALIKRIGSLNLRQIHDELLKPHVERMTKDPELATSNVHELLDLEIGRD